MRLYIAFLPLVLLLGLYGCGGKEPAQAEQAPALDVAREGELLKVTPSSRLRGLLEVAPVTLESVQTPISAPGVVEAAPDRLVKVIPPLPGKLVKLDKLLGDAVEPGEVLFTLDSAELQDIFAQLAKARSALLQTRQALERQRLLLEARIASHKEYEAAVHDENVAKNDVASALARLEQLGLRPDMPATRLYPVRAPYRGRIIELNGAQGSFWNDINAPVMTVADLSQVFITANVPERDIGAISLGQEARITLNAYEGATLSARVHDIGQMVDAETRTIKVRFALDNPEGRLKLGMFARVTLMSAPHPVLLAPVTALVQAGDRTEVFVEVALWTFQRRPVRVGARFQDKVEIIDGLTQGERIVMKNGVLLHG